MLSMPLAPMPAAPDQPRGPHSRTGHPGGDDRDRLIDVIPVAAGISCTLRDCAPQDPPAA